MRKDSGIALVQVLVMSILLLILAAGVLRIIFGTHMLVARTQASDKNRYLVEACMSQKQAMWAGNACGGNATDSCVYAVGGSNVTVNIACTAVGGTRRVAFTVDWN